MKVSLGRVTELTTTALQRFARDIERAFDRVDESRQTYEVALNFAAPGAVPGLTTQTVTIDGVKLGDAVQVAASIAVPAGFLPPRAAVTAADTVTVYWAQLTGAPADPDGSGATYIIDVLRH